MDPILDHDWFPEYKPLGLCFLSLPSVSLLPAESMAWPPYSLKGQKWEGIEMVSCCCSVTQSCPTLCYLMDCSMFSSVQFSCSVMSNSLQPHGLYSPWNSPDQNTGVGSCSLLQEIFPTQGSNPGLTHCRQILYPLSNKGSPRKMVTITLCTRQQKRH